tara:strand:+ start:60 stop:545 length:486 start_codon:yes stop_codon:yes gene_type:complete
MNILEQFAPLPVAGETVRIHFNIPKGGYVLQTRQGPKNSWKRCAYIDEAHLLNCTAWYDRGQFKKIKNAPNYDKGKGRKVCAGIEGEWFEANGSFYSRVALGHLTGADMAGKVRFNPFRAETERDGCARFQIHGEEWTASPYVRFPKHTDKNASACVEVKA